MIMLYDDDDHDDAVWWCYIIIMVIIDNYLPCTHLAAVVGRTDE